MDPAFLQSFKTHGPCRIAQLSGMVLLCCLLDVRIPPTVSQIAQIPADALAWCWEYH